MDCLAGLYPSGLPIMFGTRAEYVQGISKENILGVEALYGQNHQSYLIGIGIFGIPRMIGYSSSSWSNLKRNKKWEIYKVGKDNQAPYLDKIM